MHQLVQSVVINWFSGHMFTMFMCVVGLVCVTWRVGKRALMFADDIEDELSKHSGAYFIFLIVATIVSGIATLSFALSFLALLIEH